MATGTRTNSRNLRSRSGSQLAELRAEVEPVVPGVDDVESRLGVHRTELQIERDAQNIKNRCVAKYYGINSIKAE
jgi:hypothetical protein